MAASATAALLGGCPGGGAPAPRARGQVLGPIDSSVRVVLVDPGSSHLSQAAVGPDGRFELPLPAGLLAPWVVVHGPGGVLVQSDALADPAAGAALAPVAPWSSALRAQLAGGRVRFDWAPVAAGPGLPAPAQYSLLVLYPVAGGAEPGQSTFLTRDPWAEQAWDEFVGLMPGIDPAGDTLELVVRASGREPPGWASWVGARARWRPRDGHLEALPPGE